MITSLESQLDYFPIRILSELTGVNSVTLRAWERRYGLLKPFRTEKGHRLYCQGDVERVKKILYWINQGVSVGKVKALLESNQEPLQPILQDAQWPDWQALFVEAVLALNQAKWEQLFQDASKQYPVPVFLQKGLLPALATLHRHNDASVARLCLHSSLIELVLAIKSSAKHARFGQAHCLILSADSSSLMARLLAWSLQTEDGLNVVGGVRAAQEVQQMIARLAPSKVLLVAESIAQSEAQKWLQQLQGLEVQLTVIGAGFWLAGNASAPAANVVLYSDVLDYFS
ncbi:HTH-type transcriptional repressor YcgE [Marinomonas aquimarina]|uniref:HTH-type transcriptional repressor YcgE n=1 Tax=Marinomonas aquimarina TaxID=295068 RepID=A0A1A8TID1_9GAMM|nr:MerR family transcriptional regulator [Marinomonas aquimarina]SBS32521.1 HTH-type transcriptional repressor YcgE [Marinomonas aquimarina]